MILLIIKWLRVQTETSSATLLAGSMHLVKIRGAEYLRTFTSVCYTSIVFKQKEGKEQKRIKGHAYNH